MVGLIDITGALAPIINKALDFIPDPVAKAQAQAAATTEMLNFVSAQNTAQMAVDQAEANNKNVFVAGWRPFIGWVCGAALAYVYVLSPFLTWGLNLLRPGLPPLPAIDTASLGVLTFNLLGMGAMRTVEKMNGVAAKTAQ
jgi:hypothetical protein